MSTKETKSAPQPADEIAQEEPVEAFSGTIVEDNTDKPAEYEPEPEAIEIDLGNGTIHTQRIGVIA